MRALLGLTNTLGRLNGGLLAVGRWLGAICMGLMTIIILTQVFFRYALGNALAWPEEASRFLMLWTVGLMAATAFRRGGFVAIDMVVILLPRTLATILVLILMAQSMLLLVIGLDIAWTQTTGIGGRFATDSLWLWNPFGAAQWFKVPKGWMMASMVVGLFLLLLVAVELFLRNLVTLLGGHDGLREIPETIVLGAE